MSMRRQAKRVTLPDGAKLHYVERGKGPALVLLHGGMGDMASWPAQLAEFGGRFRTIAYSRRYSHPNRNRLRVVADPAAADVADLREFLREVGVGRAHLVGTSWGALVALRFAIEAPAQVHSLVLSEPPVHAWLPEIAGGEAVYRHFVRDVWMPAANRFRAGRSLEAMRILAHAFGMKKGSVEANASSLRNAMAMKALVLAPHPFRKMDRAAVAGLRTPTLIVAGEHSDEVHALGTMQLTCMMGAATRAVIPSAGHRAPTENPAAFNREVAAFLER